MEIEIPGSILVEILAGKTSLMKEYKLSESDSPFRELNEGWAIDDCRFRPGNLQTGEAPTVILKLSPIPSVYSLRLKQTAADS
jgi:hypothetical protein